MSVTFTNQEMIIVKDALNVRALDRQAEKYGEHGADKATDLYIKLTGRDPHESYSLKD